MANTILPKNPKNPLNNTNELRRAKKDIKSRYAKIIKELKAYFKTTPYVKRDVVTGKVVNQKIKYDYNLSPELLNSLNLEIDQIIDKWLLEGAPYGFWFNNYIDIQYESGTADAWADLSSISTSYNAARPTLENILFSAPYIRRIGLVHAATLSDWKGLTDDAKEDLRKVLREAMAAGENPRKIESRISKRLGVSNSYANQLARTEMNDANRNAQWDEAENAAQTLEVYTALLHLSALKPNSRMTHIKRHGTVHSREDQRKWYNKNGNRYNCQCSTASVLTDKNGKVLESMVPTVKRAIKQKEKFLNTTGIES